MAPPALASDAMVPMTQVSPPAPAYTETWQAMVQRQARIDREVRVGLRPRLLGGSPAPHWRRYKQSAAGAGVAIPWAPALRGASDGGPALPSAGTVATGFDAVPYNGWYPPDTMGVVGPAHFAEVINGTVAIYTRAGAQLSSVSLETFFACPGGYPHGNAFDPRVLYDRRSGRWFACTLEFASQQNNQIILAVSATGDPTGAWSKYVVTVGEAATFTDFDTLGLDGNGVYFGMNMFPATGFGAKIAATPIAPLLANPPSIGGVWTVGGITDIGSPIPAHNHDAVSASSPAWIIGATTAGWFDIYYRVIIWSGGAPLIAAATAHVTTPAYNQNVNAPAKGSTQPIEAGDDRPVSAMVRGGRLWTARGVGVNASGTGTAVDRNAAEWMVFDTSAPPILTLLDAGRVYDSSATDPWFYYVPSIMVNGQGHAVMGFSASRAADYAGGYLTVRLASDPPVTMGAPVVVKAGNATYNRYGADKRNRWGDYSATSLDPNDDMTIWTIQEYARTTNGWGTWVTYVRMPAPTLSAPATVPSVTQGTAGAALAVTGTGLYDPGAGYAGRLGATVSGAGISGVSTTWVSPTSATLTVDVAADAPLGLRDITLTNPDGQSVTLTGGVQIVSSITPTAISAEAVSGKVLQSVTLAGVLSRSSDGSPIAGETLGFEVDGAAAGSGATGADGRATASFTIPIGAGAGTRTITVRHTAGATYGSASGTASLTVSKATTALSPYAASGILGANVTLRALLVSGSAKVPGRTVAFAVDGTPAGSAVTDASGVAALVWAIPIGLGAGTHSVTLTFDGSADAAFIGSTRTAATLTVARRTASFSLYAVSGSFGDTVTLKVLMLSGSTPVAGRTVSFLVDSAAAGTGVTDAAGVATCGYTIALGAIVGLHGVTTTFDGSADPVYLSCSRTAAVLSVTKRPTAFSLYAATGPLNGTTTLKALLVSGATRPAGLRVTFAVDGVSVGYGNTDASGNAQRAYAIPIALGTGTHNVTATFAGDATYSPATRTGAVLTVTKAATLISLYAASGAAGATVTLKGLLVCGSTPLAGKTLAFSVDGAAVGTGVTDATGVAALSYTIPLGTPIGLHNLTIAFNGSADPTYASTTRTAAVLTVK